MHFFHPLQNNDGEAFSDAEKAVMDAKKKAKQEQEHLGSDRRLQQKHNKASRSMVMWNAAASDVVLKKIKKFGLKYQSVG